MNQTVACTLLSIFNLACPLLPSMAAQDVSKKQLQRAVFQTVPVASYDKKVLQDAIEVVRRQAGFGSIPKISEQDIQTVIESRVKWIETIKPNLDRMYIKEEQRLRQSGINPAQYPGQHSLLSIQDTVPLPIELASHEHCDRSTVSLAGANRELSIQRQANNSSPFYELICRPISREIDQKSGFHDSQRDANLRYLILRRAIFFHCSKFASKELLIKALKEIAARENHGHWVGDQAKKLAEQL